MFIAGMALLLLTLFILIPLSIPVHLILKLLGRRGFVYWHGDTFDYTVSGDGFRKA